MDDPARCSVCSRTPLIGEDVTVMARDRRESLVCDLCLNKPRAASLGEQVRRERIRSPSGAANVRRMIPTPVTTEPARTSRVAV